jgi:hypothetical protein
MIRTKNTWVWGLIFIGVLATLPGISRGEEPRYTNQQYGFSFPVVDDMILYTPDHAGPFTFEKGTIFIIVNKWKPNELIMLNRSAAADEVDLNYLKSQMEEQGLPNPGYHKISVEFTTIGENQRKRAVDHIFTLQSQVPRTMRYVSFFQRGQGLTFVCTSSTDRFQKTNKEFFDPFLRSIKFE